MSNYSWKIVGLCLNDTRLLPQDSVTRLDDFWNFLVNLFYKSNPNVCRLFASCENHRFLSQTSEATFGATFVKAWGTFYFNIWSHCRSPPRHLRFFRDIFLSSSESKPNSNGGKKTSANNTSVMNIRAMGTVYKWVYRCIQVIEH